MTKYIKISLNFIAVAVLAYAVSTTPAFAINVSDNGNTASAAPITVDNGTASAPAVVDNGNTTAPATQSNGNTSAPATESNGNTTAPATVPNGTTADAPAPATSNNGNTSAPATVSNGNTSAPATVSNGTTADASAPTTVENGNTSGPAATPTTPVVTPPGGSGGGSGFFSGSGPMPINPVLTISPIANCSYLTTYLKFGGNNNPGEVTKLQTFLKNIENIDVDINGQFDQKTLDAVKAFQAKYVNDTMVPWGVTTPSGEVFYTTQKKVNEIYCRTNLTLSAGQLATIEAYKDSISNGIISSENDSNATGTIQLSPEVGSNSNSQVAALANSFFGKIWSFIKWIFGYK